jgi:hypothetical protein
MLLAISFVKRKNNRKATASGVGGQMAAVLRRPKIGQNAI